MGGSDSAALTRESLPAWFRKRCHLSEISNDGVKKC